METVIQTNITTEKKCGQCPDWFCLKRKYRSRAARGYCKKLAAIDRYRITNEDTLCVIIIEQIEIVP